MQADGTSHDVTSFDGIGNLPDRCLYVGVQSLADCELNPMTKNQLASPSPAMHFKVLALKMVSMLCLYQCDALAVQLCS